MAGFTLRVVGVALAGILLLKMHYLVFAMFCQVCTSQAAIAPKAERSTTCMKLVNGNAIFIRMDRTSAHHKPQKIDFGGKL